MPTICAMARCVRPLDKPFSIRILWTGVKWLSVFCYMVVPYISRNIGMSRCLTLSASFQRDLLDTPKIELGWTARAAKSTL